MASSGKRKITMAKRAREAKLRERRVEKAARKEARKLAAAEPQPAPDADEAYETSPLEDERPEND